MSEWDETCSQARSNKPVTAKLLGSSGRGLGQQTGGSAATDRDEAMKLLGMMHQVDLNDKKVIRCLSPTDHDFLDELMDRYENFYTRDFGVITGRQLFWLRDIKDKLVSAGLV